MNKAELINVRGRKRMGCPKKDTERPSPPDRHHHRGARVRAEGLAGRLGNFDVTPGVPAIGRNPAISRRDPDPATRGPQFKAGKALKDAVANNRD